MAKERICVFLNGFQNAMKKTNIWYHNNNYEQNKLVWFIKKEIVTKRELRKKISDREQGKLDWKDVSQ